MRSANIETDTNLTLDANVSFENVRFYDAVNNRKRMYEHSSPKVFVAWTAHANCIQRIDKTIVISIGGILSVVQRDYSYWPKLKQIIFTMGLFLRCS